jgi:hypothetical protein
MPRKTAAPVNFNAGSLTKRYYVRLLEGEPARWSSDSMSDTSGVIAKHPFGWEDLQAQHTEDVGENVRVSLPQQN